METSIYQLLMWKNPQVLQSLDDFQKKVHGVHIEVQTESKEQPIIVNAVLDDTEEIDRFMCQKPHHQKRVV